MSLFFISGREAQQAREDATLSRPQPGPWDRPFEGIGTDLYTGLDRAGAGLNQAAITVGRWVSAGGLTRLSNPSSRAGLAALQPQDTDWERYFSANRDFLLEESRRLRINPATRSESANFIGGLTGTLATYFGGALAGGPAGVITGPTAAGFGFGLERQADLLDQGADPETAFTGGVIEGSAMAAMGLAPVSVPGSLLMRAGSGALINAGLGVALRGGMNAYLTERGYGEGSDNNLAQQYQWLDPQAATIDVVLGAAFGAVFGARAAPRAVRPHPTPEGEAGDSPDAPSPTLPSDAEGFFDEARQYANDEQFAEAYAYALIARDLGHPEADGVLELLAEDASEAEIAAGRAIASEISAEQNGRAIAQEAVTPALVELDSINRATAFGIPENQASRRWQSDAIARMEEQEARDEPIDPGPMPDGVGFVPLPENGAVEHLDAAMRAFEEEALANNVGETAAEIARLRAERPDVVDPQEDGALFSMGRRFEAAIRDPETGRIYTGQDHIEALDAMPDDVAARLAPQYHAAVENPKVVGFMVDGEFMGREDGLAALRARMRPRNGTDGALFSRGKRDAGAGRGNDRLHIDQIINRLEEVLGEDRAVTFSDVARELGIDPRSALAELSQVRTGSRRSDLARRLADIEEVLVERELARQQSMLSRVEAVRLYAEEGLSLAAAGERLGLTKNQVIHIARTHGIEFNARSGPPVQPAVHARDAQWLAENEAGSSFAQIAARQSPSVSRATIAGGVRRARIRRGQGTDTAPDYAAMAERLGLPEERVRAISASRAARFSQGRPIFESAVERVVSASPTARAPGAQWWATISKAQGVKKEELQWLGLEDWLKAQEGPVAREDVLAFVRENGVTVEETVLGGENVAPEVQRQILPLIEERDRVQNAMLDGDNSAAIAAATKDERVQAAYQAYREAERAGADALARELDAGEPRVVSEDQWNWVIESAHGQHRVSKTDYERRGVEGALADVTSMDRNRYQDAHRLADQRRLELRAEARDLRSRLSERISELQGEVRKADARWSQYQLPGGENYQELILSVPGIDPFEPTDTVHFGNVSGGRVIAWTRYNERIDVNGLRTLNVEEFQSRRHQFGREHGYKGGAEFQRIQQKLLDAGVEQMTVDALLEQGRGVTEQSYERIRSVLTEAELSELRAETGSQRVPDAPFKDNAWAKLALKRMIRWAAENGFEQITWTRGQHQIDRYNLSRAVGEIRAYTDNDGSSFTVTLANKDAATMLVDNGLASPSPNAPRTSWSDIILMKPDQLRQAFGNEIARKIIDDGAPTSRSGGPEVVLNGDDLRVGGEGMRAFYDKILPNIANDLGKKFGARVGETQVTADKAGWHITPPDQTVSGRWMVKSSDYNSQGLQFDTEAEAKAALADKQSGASETVHSLPITQQMREAAMEGQTLFSQRRSGFSSVAELEARAAQELGADWGALSRAGKVEIVQSSADVPAGMMGLPRGVNAVHFPDRDITYIIANNVRPEDVRGLILHEVGVHHGFEDMLGKRGFSEVLRQIDRMVKEDHPALVEARAFAERFANRPEQVPEETLAYLIEINADLPLVNRVLSRLRQWLIKTFGSTFGMRLTVDDLRSLAITSLRRVAEQSRRQSAPDGVAEVIVDPRYSGGDGPDAGPLQAGPDGGPVQVGRDADRAALDLDRLQAEGWDTSRSWARVVPDTATDPWEVRPLGRFGPGLYFGDDVVEGQMTSRVNRIGARQGHSAASHRAYIRDGEMATDAEWREAYRRHSKGPLGERNPRDAEQRAVRDLEQRGFIGVVVRDRNDGSMSLNVFRRENILPVPADGRSGPNAGDARDFPQFSMRRDGQNADNLVGAKRDPIESPDYQQRLRAVRDGIEGERQAGAGEAAGQGAGSVRRLALDNENGEPARSNAGSSQGPSRALIRAVLDVSGIRMETKAKDNGFGSVRVSIDTPFASDADIALHGEQGTPTFIDVDLRDGSDPKDAYPGLHVRVSSVNHAARGQKVGVWFYRQLIEWADRRGLPVYSDHTSMSPEAQRVYAALERRGYTVERVGTAVRDTDGYLVSPDMTTPIFRVSKRMEVDEQLTGAPLPRDDYQIDGPSLRDRQQVIDEQRIRQEEYDKKSSSEQALIDDPDLPLAPPMFSRLRRNYTASDAMRDARAKADEAAEMRKGFEAAARCAARHGAGQAVRASVVTAGVIAESTPASMLGHTIGLAMAVPFGITAAPILGQNANPRRYTEARLRAAAENLADAEARRGRNAAQAGRNAGLDAPTTYNTPDGEPLWDNVDTSRRVGEMAPTAPSSDPNGVPLQAQGGGNSHRPLDYETNTFSPPGGTVLGPGLKVPPAPPGAKPALESNDDPSSDELIDLFRPLIEGEQ